MTDLAVTEVLAREHMHAARDLYLATWRELTDAKERGLPAEKLTAIRSRLEELERNWTAAARLLAEMGESA